MAKKSSLMEQAVTRLRTVSADKEVRDLISAKDYWTRTDNDRETYLREQGIKIFIEGIAKYASKEATIIDIAEKYNLDLPQATDYVQKYYPQ